MSLRREVRRTYFSERGYQKDIVRMERGGYVVVSIEGVTQQGHGCGCFPGLNRLGAVRNHFAVTYRRVERPYWTSRGSKR